MPNLEQKIGNIFSKEESKTYPVKEGKLTVQAGIDVVNAESRLFATFENEVNQDNFLEITEGVPGTTLAAVQLASKGKLATHYNQYEPETTTALPKEDKVYGDYEPRIVGASQLKAKPEVELPLSDTNSKIKVGDALEVVDPKDGLDKSSANADVCIALESKEASSGGTILVELRGPIRVKGT